MATNGTARQPRSKRRKDTLRYYNQSDWMRPTGLVAIIAAVVLFYFGWTYVSYILASLLMPGGLFLFFYASVRHTSDADVEKERETLLRDFDSSVTGAEDYDHAVLRQPASLLTDGWIADGDARYFRRTKSGNVISDRFVRSHLFFTRDALLVCAREVSITEMDADTGAGYTDRTMRIPFADIRSAGLDEERVRVTLTKGGKPATMSTCTLVLTGAAGDLLRLPARNYMDASAFCDSVNRRVKEGK